MIFNQLEEMVKSRTSELHEVVNALEQTNSELNQFAYITSHDLQEPLRKIITFSDRLMNSGDIANGQTKEYLTKIINSAGRMRQLIHDLLEFSKATKTNQQFVSTDLNLILNDVMKDLVLAIDEKGQLLKLQHYP